MKQDIVDIYMECGDFHQAVKKSGLPIHVAHLKLLKSGALKIQDKIKYGSAAAKRGGEAEELFQKLVPQAIDANRYWKKNHPIYDFCYRGLYIDVKYSSARSSRHAGGNCRYWEIKARGSQDFICVFLERNKGAELEEPYILLLPMAFIDVKSKLHISESGPWFKEFKVDANQLSLVLDSYADLREDGDF